MKTSARAWPHGCSQGKQTLYRPNVGRESLFSFFLSLHRNFIVLTRVIIASFACFAAFACAKWASWHLQCQKSTSVRSDDYISVSILLHLIYLFIYYFHLQSPRWGFLTELVEIQPQSAEGKHFESHHDSRLISKLKRKRLRRTNFIYSTKGPIFGGWGMVERGTFFLSSSLQHQHYAARINNCQVVTKMVAQVG